MYSSLTILFFLMLFGDQEPQRVETPIGEYSISRYYTVVPGQRRYYLGRTFAQDFKINCQGDCFVTASGYRLSQKDEYKVLACPPNIPFGTVLAVEGIGDMVCEDRGGSIKGKRLDAWTGIGDRGLTNIYSYWRKAQPPRKVSIVTYE